MSLKSFQKAVLLGLFVLLSSTPLFADQSSLDATLAQIAEIAKVGRVAEIGAIQGDVWFRKDGTTEWKGAEKGLFLLEKDAIKTGENGKAEILLDSKGETGKLDLAANTEMSIETMKKDPDSDDKTTLLDLALGKVLIKVEKLKGNSSFQVKTPTSICGVRGTLFEVAVEAK